MAEIPQAALTARQMYLDGKPVSAILAETKLTLNRLYYWLDGGKGRLSPIAHRRGGGRGKAAPHLALMGRMMRAAELQMQQIEERLRAAGIAPDEKQDSARTFALLARTMRDISALQEHERAERRQASLAEKPHDEPLPRDIEALRASLSRKLEAILASPEDEVPLQHND